jgi:glucosyl-3-phosphoglycerate synthase
VRPEVQAWFARRTSLGTDWDRHELMDAKGAATVSVVLPARNEAATVGAIVERLRRDLMLSLPLVDEIVVVDSGSEDHTAAVAGAAGAVVVRQDEVLAELGDRPGKGEALWKSLYVTRGDIVAFIDADLHDFDTQFAVGLLGPLLTDPVVHFVKGFYDRPLDVGNTVLPAGGGRVTELLARPLLNLHYPALAGIVQPLAGEYAARRPLLERLPFVSGYGVEIAMLVDVLEEVGLDAMAQVDLGRRKHRNSSDAALGRMAAQVYLALVSRLERHARGVLMSRPETTFTQFPRRRGLRPRGDLGGGDRATSDRHARGVPEAPDRRAVVTLTVLMNAGAVRPQGTVIDLAFYTDGAEAVRLGEEFHHNHNGLTLRSAQIGRTPRGTAGHWGRHRLSAETIRLLRTRGSDIPEHLVTDVVPLDEAPFGVGDLGQRACSVEGAEDDEDAGVGHHQHPVPVTAGVDPSTGHTPREGVERLVVPRHGDRPRLAPGGQLAGVRDLDVIGRQPGQRVAPALPEVLQVRGFREAEVLRHDRAGVVRPCQVGGDHGVPATEPPRSWRGRRPGSDRGLTTADRPGR